MGSSLCVLPQKVLASCISQEVVQNEEEEVDRDSVCFSSMSSITNDEYGLLVGDHSEPSLEDGFSLHESIGSKDGQGQVFKSSEDLSLLHTLFLPMYSSTMTSIIDSSSFEDGESLTITMAHLGLLFHLVGADYNLLSKFMLQEPYNSLGVTYSQAL